MCAASQLVSTAICVAIRVAVDAIVVAPSNVERYKHSHALVIKPALREGTVVYEAA